MTSVFAIVRRILTQFALDKRTLALLFVAPLVVLWLLSVILGADLAAVGFDLAVLWGFLALFFALAAASFRKKRVRTTC